MLIRFACENFRSISDPVEFSFIASPDSAHADELIEVDKFKLNRVALIFGSNGSGKSTVLDVLKALKSNVVNSSQNRPDDELDGYEPHKLRQGEPCTMEIYFIKDNIKYYYSVSYLEKTVQTESLYYSPKGRMTKIFSREGSSFEFSGIFAKYNQNFQNGMVQDNKLLLSVAANNTDSKEILSAYRFFKDDISFQMFHRSTDRLLLSKPEYEKKVVALLNEVGIDVKGISVEQKTLSKEDFPKGLWALIEEERKKAPDGSLTATSVTFKEDLFDLDLEEESSGTQNMYDFLATYITAMEDGKVLLCDELEKALHPEIVKHLVEKIARNKSSTTQLIGTTHSMELLDQSLVRRDQVYFTEINKKNRSTVLYSLWDIKNVRNTENLRTNYLAGKYGAIPFIKETMEESAGE